VGASVSAPARRTASPKRERSRRSEHLGRRQIFFTAFLGLGLIAVVLIHVWLRLQVVKTGYVLSSASKLQSHLEQENRELKIELATMTSPDRLESLARRRLGLVQPEKGQIIILP
jgi:cell division protein FtsB